MKKILSLSLIAYILVSPFMAFADGDDAASDMYQDCGIGSESTACLSGPKGILKDSNKAGEMIKTINWIFGSIGIAITIFCGYKVSNKLYDEDYKGAVGPAVGGCVSILVLFIVYQFIK